MIRKLNDVFLKIFNNNLSVLTFFSFLWGTFFLCTGTLLSGFHFVDDHLIILLEKSLSEKGLFSTIINYLSADFNIRFRPIWYTHFILETKLFGSNFFLWSLYTGALAVFTSFFLFQFAVKTGLSRFYAFAFSFLSLVGLQSEIWWRTQANESIALFLFSIALFFQAKIIFEKSSLRNRLFYIIFIFLSSLSKESFVLMIPGLFFLHLWLYTLYSGCSFIQSIKCNFWLGLVLFAIFFLEMGTILLFVGSTKIGYAGIDPNTGLEARIISIMNTYKSSIFLFFFLVWLMGNFFYVAAYFKGKNPKKDELLKKYFLPQLLIFVLLILPQHILYAKSGLAQRYLIPLMIWYSFLLCFFLNYFSKNIIVKPYIKGIITITIVLLQAIVFRHSVLHAGVYAKDGRDANLLLGEVISKTHPSDSILFVLDSYQNFELSISIETYLKLIGNKENLLFDLFYNSKENDAFKIELINTCLKLHQQSIITENFNINSLSCIVLNPGLFESFLKKNQWFVEKEYEKMDISGLTVFFKRKKTYEVFDM